MARKKKGELLPREYFLEILRKEKPDRFPGEPRATYALRCAAWQETRFEAAKAVSNYCHPKLESVAHTGPNGTGPVKAHVRVTFVRAKGPA